MVGLSAAHDPLCRVDAAAGEIQPVVYIIDPVDGPAVNAHAYMNLFFVPEISCKLDGAAHRRIGRREKSQHHSVTGRQTEQLAG